jgi:hypothetical protein
LLAEFGAGRVFEVDRGGKLVWEHRDRFDARRSLLVSDALRLALDLFEADALRCRDRAAEVLVSARDERR